MSSEDVNQSRRRVLTAMTSVVGAAGAVAVATPFLGSWNPSARAKAAGAPVKIDISKVEPGGMITREWRGKPVFILRRTPDVLENLPKVTEELKDPDSTNAKQPAYVEGVERAIKPEYLILLGLCTHLGCSPKLRPEVGTAELGGDAWWGGFFCPCHGSRFDLSGRVYNGAPAPTNLEIPPYRYENDNTIIIGEDQETA